MKAKYLITGINGHLLGNVLLDKLTQSGERVRALVGEDGEHYCDTVKNCEVYHTDFNYSYGLDEAMNGVDIIYHNTVVMKYYDKNIEDKIVKPCIERTRRILEKAAEHNVKKVILVSCYITTDYVKQGCYDANTINTNPITFYEKARTEAEKLAWKIAKEKNLWMVGILPSRMIGPYEYSGHLTGSMKVLDRVLFNKVPIHPIDLNLPMNYVDVRQIAECLVKAPTSCENGKRYLIANKKHINFRQLHDIAREKNDKVKKPFKVKRWMVVIISRICGLVSKITDSESLLDVKQMEYLYGYYPKIELGDTENIFDINIKTPEELVREVYDFLMEKNKKKIK